MRVSKSARMNKAAERMMLMICMITPWLDLVGAISPLCAYHRGEPFVECLALVHCYALHSACAARFVRFDDGLQVVGFASDVDDVAELYFVAAVGVDEFHGVSLNVNLS